MRRLDLFRAASLSVRRDDHEQAMEQLQRLHPDFHAYMTRLPAHMWAVAMHRRPAFGRTTSNDAGVSRRARLLRCPCRAASLRCTRPPL